MKKVELEVKTTWGIETVEAYEVSHGYFVHRAPRPRTSSPWHVTHGRSGLSLSAGPFHTRRRARFFCESLLEKVPEMREIEDIETFARKNFDSLKASFEKCYAIAVAREGMARRPSRASGR